MKLSEYIEVCNYESITLSVYYTDDNYSNKGTFSKEYCLECFGNYDVVEISHTAKIEVVQTERNEFLDTLLIVPRIWIKKID